MNLSLLCRLPSIFLLSLILTSCAYMPGFKAPEVEQLRQQAEAGDAVSQYQMGLLYSTGKQVWQDHAAAVRWFSMAADQGHGDAEYRLGAAYYSGQGVTQDRNQAVKWLHKAAARGQPAAQYLLGVAYRDGKGVEQDATWGARWYGLAAQQGHKQAQFALGMVFAGGEGLPRQPVQSCKWLTLAERSGHGAAAKERKRLASDMTEAQRSRCRDLVYSWRPVVSSGEVDKPTVRYVQYELTRLGYEPGYIDGVAGPRTRQAIDRYWSRLGIGGKWSWEEVVLWLRGEE